MTASTKPLDWLQVLRGVAAAGVVISHAVENVEPSSSTQGVIGALNHLGSGVDLFFVISGFIMVYTTMGDRGGVRSAIRFAGKRMQRIWPTYIVLSLAIGFVTFGWSLIGDEATRIRLIKSLLFVPASYDTLFADQIIGPGWTLGFEIYFYAVFAVSLLFARWRWLFLAAWCVLTLIIVPLAYRAPLIGVYEAYATAYPVDYLKIATNPFVWEFVLGGLAAALHHSRLRIGNAWICRAIASSAVVFAVWNTFDPILPGTFGLGAGYALLIAALSLAGKTIALPRLRPLRYLGDISYTLYLQHMVVLHALLWLYPAIGLYTFAGTWLNLAITLAATIAAAALTSRFLEREMLPLAVSLCRAAWAGLQPRSVAKAFATAEPRLNSAALLAPSPIRPR